MPDQTVYDLLAKKIDAKPRDETRITVEPDSDLDRMLTWAEGFGYKAYKTKD